MSNSRMSSLVVDKREAPVILLPQQAVGDVGVIKAGDTLEDFWPGLQLLHTVARCALKS